MRSATWARYPSGPGQNVAVGMPHPVTNQGLQVLALWRLFLVVALVVAVVVYGLLIWSIIRYRRRDDTAPRQTRYNVPLEIFYTVTPVVIVAVLFAFTFRTQNQVTSLSAHPDVTVEVTGFQWQWRFHYVDEGVDVVGAPGRPPVLVIPTHATIRLVLTSADVAHSFYVPAFLFKRDLIPGVHNEVDITVTDEGTYGGACAEFCGLDHDRMTFSAQAVSGDAFRTWVASQSRGQP